MSQLVCSRTGDRYALDARRWQSEAGAPLDLDFRAGWVSGALRAGSPSMWRYRAALPIEADAHIVSLGEGWTPLIEAELLGRRVRLKLDHLMPSGSYKDRGASVLISKARELGVKRVVADSSGNAGAAIAAYAARAEIACEVFVPASTAPAKLVQTRMHGATVRTVEGSREDTAAACIDAAQRGDAWYASHVWQPWFLHGVKTLAYELVEQLDGRAPAGVVLPLGNGTLVLGCAIGFGELRDVGVIERVPRLIAVQAANCAPLEAAWRGVAAAAPAPTLAEGIAIARPQRGPQCLAAIRETGGTVIAVDEAQIVRALRAAAKIGLFIEPTSAVALAALEHVDCSGELVAPITGHGLKAVEKLARLP